MVDKYHDLDSKVKYEEIVFQPVLKDSGDLEAATRKISATAEASGTGSADYSWVMSGTSSMPADLRIAVIRRALRLLVHIDSFSTASHLYCRVYMDSQDANHRVFDLDLTGSGSDSLAATDVMVAAYSGNTMQQTVLAAINDGLSHTFYFFFWVNVTGSAVVSVVNLWQGIGSCNATTACRCLALTFTGLLNAGLVYLYRGTGAATATLLPNGNYSGIATATIASYGYSALTLACGLTHLSIKSGTLNDLSYFTGVYFWLRGEN
jgi:hypothetical protein